MKKQKKSERPKKHTKEFSPKEWKKKYYPIPADHPSLNKETRASLLKAVDHSIAKWEGLASIKVKDLDLGQLPRLLPPADLQPMTHIENRLGLDIDSLSCALCNRILMLCNRCPLYYAQGRVVCGSDYQPNTFSQFCDAPDIKASSKAAKKMVKSLKKARKLAEHPEFPFHAVDISVNKKEQAFLDSL